MNWSLIVPVMVSSSTAGCRDESLPHAEPHVNEVNHKKCEDCSSSIRLLSAAVHHRSLRFRHWTIPVYITTPGGKFQTAAARAMRFRRVFSCGDSPVSYAFITPV